MKLGRLLLPICLLFLLLAPQAPAHNVGAGLAGHRLELSVSPEEILVEYTLEIPASVWVRDFREAFPGADLLSDTEAWSAFGNRILLEMERGILCLWNGKTTKLQRLRGEEEATGFAGYDFFQYGIRLRGEPPPEKGEATLNLINRNQAAIRGVFFVGVTVSPAFRLVETNLLDPEQEFLLDSRTEEPWSLWEGMRGLELKVRPAPPWTSLLGQRQPERLDNRSVHEKLRGGKIRGRGHGEIGGGADSAAGRLKDFLRSERIDGGILLGALLLAFLLGGLHALAPGHGKALVAAYLVGTRGRPRDALALGLIVTLTHVASVILLGILSLAASRAFVPERLLPILEATSALLLVVLGLWMIRSRWPTVHPATHEHRVHHHGESQGHPDAHRPGEAHRHDADVRAGHAGTHSHRDRLHPGEAHRHEQGVPAGPSGLPEATAAGTAPPSSVRFRELLSLGISGGMVPCPSALAILLIAIAIQRIAFGMGIVVAFSLGLAAVLTSLGLLLVWGGSFLRPAEHERPWMGWLPVVSSVLVFLVGLFMLGRILIHGGLLP